MIKVIIAEDEQWIRKGIIKCIDWDGHGLELTAEASDGVKAMNLIELHKPDIVILDIHMPECDGLQLMRQCKNEVYKPKFIIISGYNYFEYARTAISLGAFAYLLKPIKKEEVNKTIQELCEVIAMERELHSNLDHIARQLSVSIPIVREKVMLDILTGTAENKTQRDFASFTSYYAVLIVGLDGYLKVRTDITAANEARITILSSIERILERYDEGTIFERGENCYVIVLGLQAQSEPVHLAVAHRVQKELNTKNYSVTIGAGGILKDVSNIKNSFNEAQKAYREKLITGGDKIITPMDITFKTFLLPEEHIKTLCIAIELFDIRAIRLGIQVMFNQLLHHGTICYETVYKLVTRIVSAVVDLALRYGVAEVAFSQEDLDFIEGMDSLADHLCQALLQVSEQIAAAKENKGTKAIAAAVQFIDLHYCEEVSLEKLAQHVNLNPNYLSEMFKKEMGINYTEYIVALRIEKAKELLKNKPWLHVSKVAELVGYANPRYFSSLFAKRTGLKPTEYKQRISLPSNKTQEGGLK
jgi:two-component system response regulator YesN